MFQNLLPFPLEAFLDAVTAAKIADQEMRGIIGVMDPDTQSPIITETLDTTTPEWRAFTEVFEAVCATRHPSSDMIEELTKRREALARSLSTTFSRLRFQQECEAGLPTFQGNKRWGYA